MTQTPARFHNFTYPEIMDDLEQVWRILRDINPNMQLLLTVSPVPLTATASEDHVLTATQYSKATLRAACGDFVNVHEGASYFPSYELVTNAAFGTPAFEANLRSVKSETVDQVMACFLSAHGIEPLIPSESKVVKKCMMTKLMKLGHLRCKMNLYAKNCCWMPLRNDTKNLHHWRFTYCCV